MLRPRRPQLEWKDCHQRYREKRSVPHELTPAQQKFVESQVAAGVFESSDKVIEAALELLHQRQIEHERLAVAFEELENGNHRPLDLEEIKAMGRELLEAKRASSEC
ncbi:hypothetical protein C5Y93_01085 [Blastopirellula marina]|uniref:Type II toxin-antitoxin system ParD family antitoxin n=1 Tax=Blastopirellula marina TaxID=124 RepID=A0A2S8GUF4_9BACT|nr:hypothetical protein C5Y93_01085 [Blastopirellula marina]